MIHHWMFSCKDVSHLISQTMDQELGVITRLGIKLHVMMCHFCLRYQTQLELVRSAMSKIDVHTESHGSITPLPNPAKKRIKDQIKNLE